MFQLLTLNGLRFIPKYDINIQELTGHNMSNLNIDGTYLIDELLKTSSKKYIEVEKLLLSDKLASISNTIKKGDIVYSYYTTGFINEISQFVKNLGFTFGTYTGEESLRIREENLRKFKSGEIDILIGSKPIGTGVDGLQEICNTMYIITLPWTDGEYTQLKGRIYRQGSIFDNVNIVIPQIKISLDNNEFWSWDIQRLNLIKNKKTLADAVVDGVLPSRILPSLETMHKKAIEALQNWKNRIATGNIIEIKRNNIDIELYPEIKDEEQRRQRIDSELSEFNRKGKTTLSSTMHKTFTDDPDSWFRYHALRKERMSKWEEIPYEYIATKIKNKKHIVVDFGCGENKMKERLPNNQVISFDHISIDESVIACDMKDVSEYLVDESIDIAVFSLALWGTNYRDYLKESYRVLNYGGFIYIAEPSKDYEGVEGQSELKTLITDAGFKLVGDIENRGKFIYIVGTKN
jgi:superfamily II DNA/RNA helicase